MKVQHDFIWGVLVHFGTNMWYEPQDKGHESFTQLWEIAGSDEMRLDRKVWNRYIDYLKSKGVNTLVIDLGDGIVYDSHPEIAVKGAWSREEFKGELDRLSGLGFELIPKLNFSSCHDAWLKEYSRMLSTPIYYKVCEELIDEVCELFDHPRFFHVGFDEEDYDCQKHYSYAVVRQNELWWNDLYRLVRAVEKNGARAVMWSDYARNHPDEYVEKCPKSVIPCNWYYSTSFEADAPKEDRIRVYPFELFEKHGFDQLPGGSSCYFDENIELLTDHCKKTISKEHLLGILQTSWAMVTEPWWKDITKAADCLERAINKYK